MTADAPRDRVFRAWRRVRPARRDQLVAALAGAFVVLVTADVLAGGLLTYLDEAVRDRLPASDDSPTWTHVVGLLGNAGVGGAAVLIAALVTMHGTLRWWPGVMAAVQLAVTGLVVTGLKYLVGRESPDQEPLDGYPGFFPSGHTAVATVSVGVVVFLLSTWRRSVSTARRRGLYAGGAGGLVVGASTVLGGFHWVSDVLASLAIAASVLVLGFAMAQSFVSSSRRRTPDRAG